MQHLLQIDVLLQIVTAGRLTSIVAGVAGLISIIIGRLALKRAARAMASARPLAVATLAVGLAGIVISLLHLASTSGGFGTGKGRAGAIVALIIGLTGMVLGGRAWARVRRLVKD